MNKALIAIDKSKSFRVYLAITTTMVEDARKIHDTSPLATAAMGRVLTGAGLMGLLLKNEQDKLTIQFKGDGPAREILATAKGDGSVKGYISNPKIELPLRDGKFDVGGAMGIGELTVIKDLGLKEPYIGKIGLVTGEVADDLTAYFFISEQQSSSVALSEKIDVDGSVIAAGGMIIQMLPEADPKSVDALEELLDKMPPISGMLEDITANSKGKTPEAVILALLENIFIKLPVEYQVEPLEYRELGWNCDCSLERLEKVIISIGQKDLKDIIEEDGQAELVCQFCEKKYHFDKEHLTRLLNECRQ
ncbi:Hsp33 family molecular chaperone HslO [Anaerovorax odorimutans]|uniref:Hsp33 family molecular chaperone HslO n=1 Tax=Anaerovorax odorimutans TaxID=109327 RepID=UPI000419CB45|nr:Hsp33 family molecular chaperone HslO [Anaerovorax odorimutans]